MYVIFSKRNNELRLLQQAKEFANQLVEQKRDLERADTFPDNCDSEVLQLRAKLLGYQNDLDVTEDRLDRLNFKIEW